MQTGMSVPTVTRAQYKLQDFLSQNNLEKFNILPRSCGVQHHTSTATNCQTKKEIPFNLNTEQVSNSNYRKITHQTITENHDNEGKGIIRITKHQTAFQTLREIQNLEEKIAFTEQGKESNFCDSDITSKTEESNHTYTDDLQRDIELEYQTQINEIYNDPEYMEQYSEPLQYQPGLHDLSSLYPVLSHMPAMFYVSLPDLTEDSQRLSPDCVSDFSCRSSCSDVSVSSDSSDEDSQYDVFAIYSTETNQIQEDNEVPIELDEELNNLVLSIISD